MVTWRPDGHGIYRGGSMGGDIAVTEAWSLRLISDQASKAIIQIDVYGTRSKGEPHDYGVTAMISYCICTDRDHPWDTEEWSDMEFDASMDISSYTRKRDVDRAAKVVAQRYAETAGEFAWDGISTRRENLG